MTLSELQSHGFDLSSVDDEAGYLHVGCSRCAALVINGTACHERGCSNTPHECRECGSVHSTREEAAECCCGWDEWSLSDTDPEDEA